MTKANEKQIAGDHYKTLPVEPWDFIARNGIPYLEGNVIKYVARWRQKNGLTDLRKAQHYLEKLIELEEENAKQTGRMPEAVHERMQYLTASARRAFEHTPTQLMLDFARED